MQIPCSIHEPQENASCPVSVPSFKPPSRIGDQVANWVLEVASQRDDAAYELTDLRDWVLPNHDEPYPSGMGMYQNEHTKRWAEKVDFYAGFINVTGEYNHSLPGSLKNTLDYVYAEWKNKAVGFVSYGSALGVRAVEHLRQIVGHLQMADVGQPVSISLFTEFENMQPSPRTRSAWIP